MKHFCALLAYVVLGFAVIAPASAQGRTSALIIAYDYSSLGSPQSVLNNTLHDASAISTALREVRVDDVQLLINADTATLNGAINNFAARLRADDLAIVYYAGHAIQDAGRNWLIAGDGRTLIAVDSLLADIANRAKVVFFIDACRENPFRGQSRQVEIVRQTGLTRSLETIDSLTLATTPAGLAQIGDLRSGQALIVFSTEPGNVAEDGVAGRGSPFANALIAEIPARQSLDRLVRRLTQRVTAQTNGQQRPWRQGDLPQDIYLSGRPRFPVP
jgi:Uncharacterized protein containing caspase domain